jgi:hypothetical protein
VNKFLIISSLSLYCVSAFSFPFHHHSKTHPAIKANTTHAENFSGLWTGTCKDESINLNIVQNFESVSLSWREGDEIRKDTFNLNKAVTDHQSTKAESLINTQFASLLDNILILKKTNLNISYYEYGAGFFGENLDLFLHKEGDMLTILDFYEEGENTPCILTKS